MILLDGTSRWTEGVRKEEGNRIWRLERQQSRYEIRISGAILST